MIAWTIAAAYECGCFDRVVVSTDDAEIADVSVRYGAEAPFVRPLDLSDDMTPTAPVIRHAIRWFEGQGVFPDEVCCLYATAPFISAADIRRGLDVLRETGCDYAFAVTRYPAPIQRAFRIAANGRVEMFHPEFFFTRSQDLETSYHDAAQFYWGRADAWSRCEPIFGPKSAPVPLHRARVQDIDTAEDWEMAEILFRAIALAETTSRVRESQK
jgi:N-acylneuraminate cytidylyltransferase